MIHGLPTGDSIEARLARVEIGAAGALGWLEQYTRTMLAAGLLPTDTGIDIEAVLNTTAELRCWLAAGAGSLF